ncbi:hypothetical protein R5R35_009231 [Gryllus longicercus]|uniref:TIR domain-containing protein n=1 Tax=Gryllus longicercus TaxID=2509291 RepID=A0AAN9VFT3_9ORTH
MYVKLDSASKTSSGEFRRCAKMGYWKGTSLHDPTEFHMQFQLSSFYVAVVTERCQNKGQWNCTFEIKVRADVLSLPPFSFTTDEHQFWNFSSPLFRADLGWLITLKATAAVDDHYPSTLPGLSGSSVERLELNGSFGTDNAGPLPHLDHLANLLTLRIHNSSLTELTPDDMNGTESIFVLNITHNKFREIPSALKILEKVKSFVFESIVQDFIFNPHFLQDVTGLNTLNLSHTYIRHWQGKFPRMYKLRSLFLDSCRMKIFSAAESDFPHLHLLSLCNNFLTFLTMNAFVGLPKLAHIFLTGNPLRSLNPHVFIGYPLQQVDVASCRLTKCPELPCSQFSSINFSHNQITTLINLGYQIEKVHSLDISYNNIVHWKDKNIFLIRKSCRRHLSFQSENKSLPGSASHPWIYSAYKRRPWVTDVNISHNNISFFSEAMLQSLAALKQVDLGGNAIDCGNCRASLLQQWLDTTTTRVKNLGEDKRLTCSHPAHMRGHLVQEVDFDAMCFTPRRRLWLGMELSLVGVVVVVMGVSGLGYYYRTELAYLVHLAKVRSTSKRKNRNHSEALYDTFVCYSGKKRKWVFRRLVPLLECRPEYYSLCLFDRDFRLGTHIVSNIVDAIEHSRKVIVVLTQHFIDSKWCQWELEMAQHKLFSEDREFLVLLELEPLERRRLPRLLRFLLDTRPVVRWPRPETAPAVKAAAAELRRALGPSLLQRPRPLPHTVPAGEHGEPSAPAMTERTPLLREAEPAARL